MVHENAKNMKLEVPPDDTAPTLRDAIITRVQWRGTSIDIDPAVASLASTIASQPNNSPGLIFRGTQLD
jgi:hypothetical protein